MFDVAIVGGGLAGCNAALALAHQNRRVLLLEAKPYPHPKVCGEFLSPECVALFAASKFLPVLQQLNPVNIKRVRVTSTDGSTWKTEFPAPAFGISRYALDEAFVRFAAQNGVEVHDSARVTEIDGSLDQHFSLTARTSVGRETFRAATVIAAHGKRSNLDRRLNRGFLNSAQPFIALKRHFIGPPLPEEIHLHVFPGGYCGISEIEGGHMNVCMLVRQTTFQAVSRDARDQVDPFVSWIMTQNPFLRDWLEQATPVDPKWLSIAQVPFVDKTTTESDILMAGDAAGLVAPLAGDGMAMALHSGRLAAQLIDQYLDHRMTSTELKTTYSRAWNATFKNRVRLGRALQAMMLRPAMLEPGLRLLNVVPSLGRFLVENTRDMSLVER